jgi:hypothetical protein
MLVRDDAVTVRLLFGCQTELHYPDPKRSPGDLSQIYAETARILRVYTPPLLLVSLL